MDTPCTNWCCAAVSVGEQLLENYLVRPKYVTVKYDFTDIVK
jgi:hypothetical protein